jgi:hypothetical protein
VRASSTQAVPRSSPPWPLGALRPLPGAEAALSGGAFVLALAVALALLSAYALYQIGATGGYLFYTNGFDEASYLDYGFSRSLQRPSRSGQYLVTLGHHVGVPGGWMNLLFDVVSTLAFVLLGRRVLGLIGFSAGQARLGALLVTLLPLLFGGLNPLVRRLFDLNLSRGLVFWVTVPEASTLPVLRSPEPQVSLVLLALALYVSIRRRAFWPAYLCMPLLYPFIAVPFAFAVLAVHVRVRTAWAERCPAVAPLLAFAVVSLALWAYFSLYLDDGARQLLVESRYPLVSFTSAVGLVVYPLLARGIPTHLRYAALMIALAPLAAANQQVVSGWLAQPNNVEQFFGVSALAVITTLGTARGAWAGGAAGVLAAGAVVLSAQATWADNRAANRGLALTAETLRLFRDASAAVMINDVTLASRASMLFPMQPSTLLAYQRTFPGQAAKHLAAYVCAREATRRDPLLEREFRDVFLVLDRAYRHENLDFVLLHVGRRRTATVTHRLDELPDRCPAGGLHYLIVGRR